MTRMETKLNGTLKLITSLKKDARQKGQVKTYQRLDELEYDIKEVGCNLGFNMNPNDDLDHDFM